METFKEFLQEGIVYKNPEGKYVRLGSEYSFHYRDKFVIDTKHILDRIQERGEANDLNFLLKKTIDYVIDRNARSKEYLFASKSKRIGIVVDYREDKNKSKSGIAGNQIIIVTWLGRKTSAGDFFAKAGTDKVILESLQSVGIEYVEFA